MSAGLSGLYLLSVYLFDPVAVPLCRLVEPVVLMHRLPIAPPIEARAAPTLMPWETVVPHDDCLGVTLMQIGEQRAQRVPLRLGEVVVRGAAVAGHPAHQADAEVARVVPADMGAGHMLRAATLHGAVSLDDVVVPDVAPAVPPWRRVGVPSADLGGIHVLGGAGR